MNHTATQASLKNIYQTSLALLTDFYELSMAYGYWRHGIHEREAVFHHFFRRPPFMGGYAVAAGLESVIALLKEFRFSQDDLNYLADQKNSDGTAYFDEAFLRYLESVRFACDIDAVPEGTIVFPFEPLVRVKGPLLQAQFFETILLNQINFPTLIATKAARICTAAQGDTVLEFGLRRAQGIDGGLTASRAAYIGGCMATSNVLASKLFDIPSRGTMAHSWVQVFEDELTSFRKFAEALPKQCIFLVDTFNSLHGVNQAIQVAKEIAPHGHKLLGVRLDSGDLSYLSQKVRRKLDDAGYLEARIYASNELDEVIISDLKRQGAKIDVWGVGTHLATGSSQAALGGVYKLSAIQDSEGNWINKLKLSEQIGKISNPGIHQIRRFHNGEGYFADVLYDIEIGLKLPARIIDPLDPTRQKILNAGYQAEDLLVPIFRKGGLVYSQPKLKEIRLKVQRDLAQFDPSIKRFIHPHQYVVGMEENLYEAKVRLIKELRQMG